MSEQKYRESVTVLGLGAMGSALARAFLRGGQQVTVWNRTASRMRPLEEAGALGANSAAQAVEASSVVVVNVLDYQASRSILEPEEVASRLRGKVLVQLTTGAPREAREMARWAQERGITYLDGAILCYPNGIGTEAGALIYSGSAEAFEAHRHLLLCLGGQTSYVGTEVANASILELCLLNYYYVTFFGFMQNMALCEAEGFPLEAHTQATLSLLPIIGETIKAFGAMAEKRNYDGNLAALEVHAVAYRLIARELRAHRIDGGITGAIEQHFEKALAAGLNRKELGALFEVIRRPAPRPGEEA